MFNHQSLWLQLELWVIRMLEKRPWCLKLSIKPDQVFSQNVKPCSFKTAMILDESVVLCVHIFSELSGVEKEQAQSSWSKGLPRHLLQLEEIYFVHEPFLLGLKHGCFSMAKLWARQEARASDIGCCSLASPSGHSQQLCCVRAWWVTQHRQHHWSSPGSARTPIKGISSTQSPLWFDQISVLQRVATHFLLRQNFLRD